MIRYPLIILSILLLCPLSGRGEVEFNRDIRPILSANCYFCHGPDEHGRKAKLRLDSYEAATAIRKDGSRAIDPAKLSDSAFIHRMLSTDLEERMPPEDSNRTLKPHEIALLTEWIKSGAEYKAHWAFEPVHKAEPAATRDAWVKNAIDPFTLEVLKDKDLIPSPEASREALIRRVAFDLTGLPPTLEAIDRFLADTTPQAYEKMVDQYLASEHYGERMALAWMDASRYGDTSVMHADGPRTMWPWRSWVIRSYNTNKPFDQFTVEQLAGDLIPDATDEQKLATGFNRNHATSDEGGAFPEELRVDYIVDRVQTTANVWMGLSMECAQCHDHKYDPITQKEYYRFFAYFNNNKDPGMQTRKGNQSPTIDIADPKRAEGIAKFDAERKELEAKVDERRNSVGPQLAAWVEAQRKELQAGNEPPMPVGLIAHLPLDDADGKTFTDIIGNHSGKLKGKFEKSERGGNTCVKISGNTTIDFPTAGTELEFNDAFTLAAWVKTGKNSGGAVFSRMKTSEDYRGYDLWMQGGSIGTHIIHKWQENAVKVVSKPKLRENVWEHVAVSYDGSGKAAGVQVYINGQPVEHTVEADNLTATIKNDAPFRLGSRTDGGNWNGEVDDIRIYKRALAQAEVARLQDAGDALKELLATSEDQRSPEQTKALSGMYLNQHDEAYKQLLKEQAGIGKRQADFEKKYPKANSMIMADNENPRMTYVLMRGAYDAPNKEEEIKPETPSFLPPPAADAPANRLGLANWLVQKDHPLTSRVTVNRYWAMLFGEGLVSSVMDFGNQGAPPSHPELLDWLAADFVEHGWDIKRTLKQIVMSATYRQSSRIRPELLNDDPENHLLAHGPRFRLQGEFIRDHALSVSGLLVDDIGGASVKPYQPPGLWNEVSINAGLKFQRDKGEGLYRRSMYTYWKRSAPPPSMTIFDAPSREKCVVQRARTITPLQALVTLNDEQFVEASRHLAQRMVKEGGASFEERIHFAFRLNVSRKATPQEIAVCREVYEAQLASFQADVASAKKYLTVGESVRDEGIEVSEHAAWTVIANMILNLDEVLTRG
ncbi:MAG: dsDNA-binding SOS-regulon protein [Kiritimatiellia bacterium]|jgi:dsDNA-binding SOS-regulon protein